MDQQESRGTGRFSQGLYEATKRAILAAGAPEDVAEDAARVVAKDDPKQENLGRTAEDQDAIWRGWTYLAFGGSTNDQAE